MSTQEYQSLNNETRAFGEHNDCVVKAIALVCNVSYNQAHMWCAIYGRKFGQGMFTHDWMLLLADRSYRLEHHQVQQKTTYSVLRERRMEQGTWLIFTKHHVAVMKGGKLHDFTSGRQVRILGVMKVHYPEGI